MTIYSNFVSYISFSLQKFITTHLKPKWLQGSVCFLRDKGFRIDSLYSILKFLKDFA